MAAENRQMLYADRNRRFNDIITEIQRDTRAEKSPSHFCKWEGQILFLLYRVLAS